MAGSSKRALRVADLVRRSVAKALQTEVQDPRLNNVSVASVEMAPDMKSARIYYTLLDETQLEAVQIALKKASGYLRHMLAQETELRYTPALRFIYDDSSIQAERLSRLIDKANKSDDSESHD